MRRAALTSACLLCLVTATAAQQDVMAMRAEPLGLGLTVISGFANGNILVLSGPEGTLLVDAQSARRAGLADSVLASLGAPPVRWVLNTHYHSDHTEGNTRFRGRGAEIIGQANLPTQMAKDTTITDWHEWHRTPADPASIPTRTFQDSLTLHVNGQRVLVTHIPAAHTDGDAIAWLPDANVIHIGDLFEHQAPPFIDWWAGGGIEGMLAGVDWGLAHSDSATRIVPGHGPVGNRADDFVALLYVGLKGFEPTSVAERLTPGTPESRLPWLLGCWQTSGKGLTIEERWIALPDGSLAGRGRTVRNGTVVDSEVVTITARGDTLVYTANPAGQAQALFLAPTATDSSVAFANPAHDFPTRVGYRRVGAMGLTAEVAGPVEGRERTIPFPYAAVVCQGS